MTRYQNPSGRKSRQDTAPISKGARRQGSLAALLAYLSRHGVRVTKNAVTGWLELSPVGKSE